jgi:uncharacterized protein (TIGR02996 family)
MPRFEFSQGSSNKFWEITLSGDEFTVCYGRIGTAGTTQHKVYPSADKAKAEYDKMIGKKTKKGYVEVASESSATPVVADPEAELVAAIHADPSNADNWLVYADILSAAGDPRGELIAGHFSGKRSAEDLAADQARLLETHEDAWLGKDLAKLKAEIEAAETYDEPFALTWQHGFIHTAKVGLDYGAAEEEVTNTPAQVRILMASPAARFLHRLEIGLDSGILDGEPSVTQSVTALCRSGKQPQMRELLIGNFHSEMTEVSWMTLGDETKVLPYLPNLEFLHIHGGYPAISTFTHPKLKRLFIETGGLPENALKALATINCPQLENLDVWLGDDGYGGVGEGKGPLLRPLLSNPNLPKVTHLGLKNASIQNEVVQELVGSKLLKQLKTLDLSMGCMNDDGARILFNFAEPFSHLERIDISDNFITEAVGAELRATYGDKMVFGSQKTGSEYNGEVHYYCSVGE